MPLCKVCTRRPGFLVRSLSQVDWIPFLSPGALWSEPLLGASLRGVMLGPYQLTVDSGAEDWWCSYGPLHSPRALSSPEMDRSNSRLRGQDTSSSIICKTSVLGFCVPTGGWDDRFLDSFFSTLGFMGLPSCLSASVRECCELESKYSKKGKGEIISLCALKFARENLVGNQKS